MTSAAGGGGFASADRAHARLAAIVESADDAIISKNLDGIIETWNPAAEHIFGYRAEEVVDQHITILIPPDRHDEERDILERIRRGEHIRHYETVRVRKDGCQISVSLTVSPIKGSAGDIIGASKIARDISARRRMEEELIRAKKLETVALLAGGIAHDFNNLLTGVFGNLQLARLRLEDVMEPLTQAEQTFKRAHELTHRLLTFSSGGAPIRKMTCIADLLHECVVETMRAAAIATELDIAPDLWPTAVDVHQMAQAIKNLLINAREAMPNGGRLHVLAENRTLAIDQVPGVPAGSYVAIRVADTGMGISDEHVRLVFDPYFTTKSGGTGLGLSVVYSIVHRHDGHIGVQSRPGEGTTFTIYLPTDQPGGALRRPGQV